MAQGDNQQKCEGARANPRRTWIDTDPNVERADADRIAGMEDFVNQLNDPANKDERDKCVADPHHAKCKFAEWEGFYLQGEGPFPGFEPIPTATVFNVYEPTTERDTGRNRDKEVVIILDPIVDPNAPPVDPEAYEYTWRCTYTPYKNVGVKAQRGGAPEGAGS